MTEKKNDLDVLLPDRDVTLSNGESVTVRPLTFTQIPKGSMHIERVINAVMQSGVLSKDGEFDLSALISEENEINLSVLMGLLAAGGGHVNELLLLCTYKDGERVGRDWLESVSAADGLELTRAFIGANWKERENIAKKLESLSTEVRALLEAGAASSNGSSGTDTGGATSRSTPSARSSAS